MSPVDATLAQPANDFALIFEYGACGTNRLDTFRSDFTQNRITEPPIITPITITLSDKITIYQKIVAIDFFSYPPIYTPPSPNGLMVQVNPEMDYLLIVRNQGQTKAVGWNDNFIDPKSAEADPLHQLGVFLIEMIDQKPEIKRLPPLKAGCM